MTKETAKKTGLTASLVLILGFVLGQIFPFSSMRGLKLGATDFGMDIDQGINKEEAIVLNGPIDYRKKRSDGSFQTIAIRHWSKADVFDEGFRSIEIPPAMLAEIEEAMQFKKLKDKADKLKSDN